MFEEVDSIYFNSIGFGCVLIYSKNGPQIEVQQPINVVSTR